MLRAEGSGNVEPQHVVERVSTERFQAETSQALLILVSQLLMAQALARVVLALHLSFLRCQLILERSAIVQPILRDAATKAVPRLSRRT